LKITYKSDSFQLVLIFVGVMVWVNRVKFRAGWD